MLDKPCLVDRRLLNHLRIWLSPVSGPAEWKQLCPLHRARASCTTRLAWDNFSEFSFISSFFLWAVSVTVLSSSASTTAMRSYSSSSLSSPWNLSRRNMRQRELPWVSPLVSYSKKNAWVNIYSSLHTHFFLWKEIQCFQWENSQFQWETVKYFDNKIICDLIEEKHKGIISILVCKMSLKFVFSCHFHSSQSVLLLLAEWRVSETRRNLWPHLSGEIGRHAGQPSPLHHVNISRTRNDHCGAWLTRAVLDTCVLFPSAGVFQP